MTNPYSTTEEYYEVGHIIAWRKVSKYLTQCSLNEDRSRAKNVLRSILTDSRMNGRDISDDEACEIAIKIDDNLDTFGWYEARYLY